MKILIYSNGFGDKTTTFIRNEIYCLLKNKCIIKYLCNETREIELIHENFELIRVPIVETRLKSILRHKLKLAFLKLFNKNAKFQKEVIALINQFKPDLIYCHFFNESLILFDNLTDNKISSVIHFHGYDASKFLNNKKYVRRINEFYARRNVHFLFPSYDMKQRVEKYLKKKISASVIYYAIDYKKFSPQKSEDQIVNRNEFIFLQVSGIFEKKGHEFTLIAFKNFLQSLPADNSKKYIYQYTGDGNGDPELAERLLHLTKTLKINDNVQAIGFVTPSKAVELMDNANCFIHNSITPDSGDMEGIPNAIMEAMSMKLPVISTFHSGIPELVEDNTNGILVEEKNVDEYVSAFRDIQFFKCRLEVNRQKIISDFSLKNYETQLYELLKEKSENDY